MIRINGGPLDGQEIPLDDVHLWLLKPEAHGYVVSDDGRLEDVEINYDEDFFDTIQRAGGTLWDEEEDEDYSE